MNTDINRLLDVDKEACRILEEARRNCEESAAKLEEEKRRLREEYASKAQRHIQDLEECLSAELADAEQQVSKRTRALTDELQARCNQMREQWVRELVEKCVRR